MSANSIAFSFPCRVIQPIACGLESKVNIWSAFALATSWLNGKLLRPGLKSRKLHHQCNPEADTDVIGASLRTNTLTTRMP